MVILDESIYENEVHLQLLPINGLNLLMIDTLN